jgi:hypothetical protein
MNDEVCAIDEEETGEIRGGVEQEENTDDDPTEACDA